VNLPAIFIAVFLAATPLAEDWYARPLTSADLEGRTADELRILRNEIYARHGYVFKSEELAARFKKESWYHETPAFDPASLTGVEKANVALLKKTETERRGQAQSPKAELPSVTGVLTTVAKNGKPVTSKGALRAVLECVEPEEDSKGCDCNARITVYDDASRRKVAFRNDAIGGQVWCYLRRFELSLLDLGAGFGALLRISASSETYVLDIYENRKDPQKESTDHYFALTTAGSLAEVAYVIRYAFQPDIGPKIRDPTFSEWYETTRTVEVLPGNPTQGGLPSLRKTDHDARVRREPRADGSRVETKREYDSPSEDILQWLPKLGRFNGPIPMQ
jgi:hypothetical protein